jgi:hypothetical protein
MVLATRRNVPAKPAVFNIRRTARFNDACLHALGKIKSQRGDNQRREHDAQHLRRS